MEKRELWDLMVQASIKTSLVHEHFEVQADCFGKFNGLNTSSLYSFLIKEAGRLCDGYASDLFYDLKTLDEALSGNDSVLFDNDRYYWAVGIRDLGVDHDQFIMNRIEEHLHKGAYRKMYFLEVKLDEEARYGRYFDLDLYEVSLSYMDACIRRKEMAL